MKFLEPLIIVLLSLTIISLSFFPQLHYLRMTPPNTIYLGVHNYILDYYIYLSFITQGQLGSPLAYELHTSELHTGSLSHIMYLASGWLTAPTNLPPYVVYHIIRLFGALFLAVTIYWFISLFINKKSKLSSSFQRTVLFILSFAISGIPLISKTPEGTYSVAQFVFHLSFLDPIRRSAFLPHGTTLNAIFLLALGFLIKSRQTHNKKPVFIAGILLFILNLFSPFHSGLVLGSFGLYSLLLIIKALVKKNFPEVKRLIIDNITLILLFLPSFIYIQQAYSQGPLANIRKWETYQLEDIGWYFANFSRSLGPTFFLGFIGILIAIKKGALKNFFLVFLTIITYLFVFNLKLDKAIGVSNFRFLGIPTYVFLGILSFYLIEFVASFFKRFQKILIVLIVAIFLLQSIPTDYSIMKQLTAEQAWKPYNAFLPKDIYEGFMYLKKTTDKRQDIILSKVIIGNLIPAFSGNRVFLGHSVSTINFAAKSPLVNSFFAVSMPIKEAQKFLTDNKITYIFMGPEEYNGELLKSYPFLKPVFTNTSVTIFKP